MLSYIIVRSATVDSAIKQFRTKLINNNHLTHPRGERFLGNVYEDVVDVTQSSDVGGLNIQIDKRVRTVTFVKYVPLVPMAVR